MLLSDAIVEYVDHIRCELGYSAVTVMQYQNRLRYFHKWLLFNGYSAPTILDLSVPLLRRYLRFLTDDHQRPRTIKGKLAPVDGLCRFLVADSLITTNPMDSIKLPKLDAARRVLVTDEQILLLFAACENSGNARQVGHNRAVLTVLAYAGLRRAECRDLRPSDFDPARGSLLVRAGKGSHSRTVYLPTEGITNLKEWLALRGECNHEFMFGTAGRRLHDDGMAHLIERLKQAAGLESEEGIKPHSIRHAWATRIHNAGGNLQALSTALGHRGANALRTTQIYLHADEKQAEQLASLSAVPRAAETAAKPASAAYQSRRAWRLRTVIRQ